MLRTCTSILIIIEGRTTAFNGFLYQYKRKTVEKPETDLQVLWEWQYVRLRVCMYIILLTVYVHNRTYIENAEECSEHVWTFVCVYVHNRTYCVYVHDHTWSYMHKTKKWFCIYTDVKSSCIHRYVCVCVCIYIYIYMYIYIYTHTHTSFLDSQDEHTMHFQSQNNWRQLSCFNGSQVVNWY